LEQRCGGEQLKSIWSVIKFLQKRINFMAGPGCRGLGENRKSISISGPKRQKSKGPEKKRIFNDLSLIEFLIHIHTYAILYIEKRGKGLQKTEGGICL